MIPTIIYSTICTAVLWVFYKLVLERETVHLFKRVYLLLIFPISWVIPLLQFRTRDLTPTDSIFLSAPEILRKTPILLSNNYEKAGWQKEWLYIIYLLMVLILFARFALNLFSLWRKSLHGKSISFSGIRLVVTNEKISPYSFGKSLFVNREHYENGIASDILIHEKAHIMQGHTWDVIFAELIIAINWFNPIAWILRRSIQLNHEFLADRMVLNTTNDINSYQNLLLYQTMASRKSLLTSQFNNQPLKKRICMMFRKSSLIVVACKQLLLLPIIVVLIVIFAERTVAQGPPAVTNRQYPAAKENAPTDILQQYQAILDKFHLDTREGQKDFFDKISPEEKKELARLFGLMSKEQQNKQNIGFMKRPKPLAAFHPTTTQFEKWKNGSVYGVWLNDKKIKNSELAKYTEKDIAHFIVSKLYGKARSSVNYSYQVNLMTNEYYAKYVEEQKAIENEPLMYIKWMEKEKN